MLKTFCHLHDEEGIFRFYVGGTLGVDMWAAEQLLYLKEHIHYITRAYNPNKHKLLHQTNYR